MELAAMQANKLRRLVRYAYLNVAYYRNLFKQAGVKPRNIKHIGELTQIPVTTRLDFQRVNFSDRIAKGVDLKKCLNLRTSGSTGRPLDVFVSKQEHFRSKTAAFLSMYFANGCSLTDKTLRVVTPAYISKKRWFQRLGILREYFVSMFDDIDIQLNTYLKAAPEAIRGYTSGIKSLALSIKEKGIKIKPPKAIFTTAEVLDKTDRRIISGAFKARVIDYYCCNEVGIIAFECSKQRGYHLNNDNVIVEIIKDDGAHCAPGEEGAVVITGLNRLSMPFIRYQIGDRAVFKNEKCACGCGNISIEEIRGRENDQIVLSEGKAICPYLFCGIIKEIAGIMEFQIIQKALDNIQINIVKDKNLDDDSLIMDRVKKESQNALGAKAVIGVSIVKEIPKDKTGKAKFIKSEINSPASSTL